MSSQRSTDDRSAWAKPVAYVRSYVASAGVLVVGLALLVGIMLTAPASSDDPVENKPGNAHSTRYAAYFDEFAPEQPQSVLVVYTRDDGGELTSDDKSAATDAAAGVFELATRGPVQFSDDGKAALAITTLAPDLKNTQRTEAVDAIVEAAKTDLPDGLTSYVTGGPAFATDVSRVFQGADITLFVSAVIVVAVLLLITYRSPTLWLIPLIVVLFTDRAAASLAPRLADFAGLTLDGATLGITNVLVFGAGANYSLLLISRYREELRRVPSHRHALQRATAASFPAVLASNITVVLALFVLLFAAVPSTRALGLIAGTMLLFTVVSVMFILPAALALVGRPVFWPFVPRPQAADELSNADDASGIWFSIAKRVTGKPVPVLVASVLALIVLALGSIGTTLGLSVSEQFTTKANSVTGLEKLADHFPAGSTAPVGILTSPEDAEIVAETTRRFQGVTSVAPDPASGNAEGKIGDKIHLLAVLDAEPSSPEAFTTIKLLRAALPTKASDPVLIGGNDATELDYRDASMRDLALIVPIILAVVFGVLVFLLQALAAPIVLMASTTLSALAALGAGLWVSTNILGYPGVATSVVLFAFLFLVALGVDYTIFLMTRTREEADTHPTKVAIVRAVGLTGPVITSAGVVLAAVFVVLGVLPLIVLAQLGAIVCLGILLDTFLVRTVVVPAICSLFGERMWWPGRSGYAEVSAEKQGHPDKVGAAL